MLYNFFATYWRFNILPMPKAGFLTKTGLPVTQITCLI